MSLVSSVYYIEFLVFLLKHNRQSRSFRKLKCESSCGHLGSRWRIGRAVRIFVVKWEWQVLLIRCVVKPGYGGIIGGKPVVMRNGEKKTTTTQNESWKQKFTGNEAAEDKRRYGWTWCNCNKISSSSNSPCISLRTELNGEGELEADPSPKGYTAWRKRRRTDRAA